jgi:hypothetical protein
MKQSLISQILVRFASETDIEELIVLFDQITSSIQNIGGKWSNYRATAEFSQKSKTINKIIRSDSKIFVAEYNKNIIGAVNVQIINNMSFPPKFEQS